MAARRRPSSRPANSPPSRPRRKTAQRGARPAIEPPRKLSPAARSRGDNAPAMAGNGDQERLQKVLAAAGIGTRRHCEELIVTGRVEVDRQTVTELGTKVDPARQEIRVDGQSLPKQRKVYYVVHKPPGVLSTNYDQSGRPRVIDLLPEMRERLFTVGRLDMSSEGLILVTNDGELANRLTHPRYGVEKTYHVLVAGELDNKQASLLTKGVHLAEGWAKADRVKVRSQRPHSTLLEIVLTEGRNREIRRLLARVGHKVLRLKRVAIGGVRLADLPQGEYRRLRNDELKLLQQSASRKRKPAPRASEQAPAASTGRPAPAKRPAKRSPAKGRRP